MRGRGRPRYSSEAEAAAECWESDTISASSASFIREFVAPDERLESDSCNTGEKGEDVRGIEG